MSSVAVGGKRRNQPLEVLGGTELIGLNSSLDVMCVVCSGHEAWQVLQSPGSPAGLLGGLSDIRREASLGEENDESNFEHVDFEYPGDT